MVNNVYIYLDKINSLVYSYGIEFKDFIKGIGGERNYLILAGFPDICDFNYRIFVEYVTKEKAKHLLSQNVNKFGDFCWVDFQEEEQLDLVTYSELSEMLFMSHMKFPLNSFSFSSLKNEYAYLCHDDGTWNTIYMKDVSNYKKVIDYKLANALNEVAKADSINHSIYDYIFERSYDGILIDFDHASNNEVNLFNIGRVATVDELESKLIEFRKGDNKDKLYWNASDKSWNLSQGNILFLD